MSENDDGSEGDNAKGMAPTNPKQPAEARGNTDYGTADRDMAPVNPPVPHLAGESNVDYGTSDYESRFPKATSGKLGYAVKKGDEDEDKD